MGFLNFMLKVLKVVRDKYSKKVFEKVTREYEKEQAEVPKESVIKAPEQPPEVVLPVISVRGVPANFPLAPLERYGQIADLTKFFTEKETDFFKKVPRLKLKYEEMRSKINLSYPLIQAKIDGEVKVFAKAKIFYDKSKKALIYYVIEPEIDEKERKLIEDTLKMLEEKIDIDFASIKNIEKAYDYIEEKTNEIWEFLGVKLPKEEELKVKYYIYRDTVGLGKIEPLMHDPYIEDISCDGVGIPVYVYHRNPIIGEIQTNIVFETEEELDSFVMKLAQRTGRPLSAAQPLLDGTLPDGSRVQITYGKDIARRGSNFTIRKFTVDPLTPIDLIKFGTASPEIFAYLWSAIENQMSILIAGGTATGKTTFLNAIALFIRPELKIISIEDTAELQLPHPNWVPQVARPGFGPSNYGAIGMFDLLKAALRQRPDYIIIGEVRGKEAYVLFQGMATGHPALGTIHADTMEAVIDRLTSPPISLPLALLENLDIVTFMIRTKYKESYVRRVDNVVEVVGYNSDMKKLLYMKSFEWDPKNDKFRFYKSVILKKIMELKGLDEEKLRWDLKFKRDILMWLVKKNIRYYKDVAKYIAMYYYEPEELMKIIYGEK